MTRRGKLLRNTVCIVLLLILCYRLLSCPPLTAMHAFRQAERQNLAEPSEVIARIPGEKVTISRDLLEQFGERNVFGDLGNDWIVYDLERTKDYILGEKDGTFYCYFWRSRTADWWEGGFIHRYLSFWEKTGAVTVMPINIHYSEGRLKACVLLLHTELAAVSASVEVREVRSAKGQYYSGRCSGEGAVHENGVFVIATYQCAERSETTQEHYESMKDLMEVHLVLKNAAGDVIYDETVLV